MNAREINIFFNCLLIRNRVRQAYLSEHTKPESIRFMKNHFPDLIIKPWIHNHIQMTLVSYQSIDDSDLQNPKTLGMLLGYPGADEYQTLDHANAYIYCFEYTLKDSKQSIQKPQRLFGNKCATERDADHSQLLNAIQTALQKSPVISSSVATVYVRKNPPSK